MKRKKSLLSKQEIQELLELKSKLQEIKDQLEEGKEKYDSLQKEQSLIIFSKEHHDREV